MIANGSNISLAEINGLTSVIARTEFERKRLERGGGAKCRDVKGQGDVQGVLYQTK